MSLAWDDEPDDDIGPDTTAPRKKRRMTDRFAKPRIREAPAPLADFLRDPSLLPKRPPGSR